jgi:glycerophosphoryl diester phosphodiesterase
MENKKPALTITAHAGALGTKANTRESLIACMDFVGEGCVEADVRFDSDGTPVLSHDPLFTGKKAMPLSELFELLNGNDTRVNLDLKEKSNLPELQRLAEKYGVSRRLFFTGVPARWAHRVKKNAPLIPFYLNKEYWRFMKPSKLNLQLLADKIKRLGAVGVNTPHAGASAEMVDIMHKNGLLVSVYTVNSEASLRRAISFGTDSITTRRPDILKKLLEESNQP